ncbi:transposase [Streptomyces pseudovenezuelae]|uniref:Transposase n=1 Tax=Streptomyces pseudovenezuelae TaxID=67350 RepID=A0ABT6LZ81_9ACTN|nr:transposase [Streptomyces pseudovenezuelae]
MVNRLTSPAPLVRVGDWARTWAVEEVFGIEPALLNDDRLARALDAIAPELDRIAGTVGARAIAEFGIDVSRLHWDMTSMSVHGAFPAGDQDEQYPVIGYGRPGDRRVDLKQVQAGLAVSADGGIQVHARVFDGGAAEVSQVVGAMKDLQGMAGAREFLMEADSKLVSYTNVAALLAAGVDFSAPVPAAQVKDEVYAALDLEQAQAVDWVPERDVGKPAAERESYRVLEDIHTMAGRRKRDPVHRVRRILVHSTAVAAGQPRGSREATGPGRRGDGQACRRGGRPTLRHPPEDHRPDRSHRGQAARHLLPALDDHRRRRRTSRPSVALRPGRPGGRGRGGRLVGAADEHPGRAGRLGPDRILVRYKGQGAVERRYHDFKSAKDLRVSKRSVERWRAWREGGMDALASTGPPKRPKLSDGQVAELEKELALGPAEHGWEDQRWTLARVRVLIAWKFQVDCSMADVWRLLHRHVWSCQCPTRRAVERDAHAMAEGTCREVLAEQGVCLPYVPVRACGRSHARRGNTHPCPANRCSPTAFWCRRLRRRDRQISRRAAGWGATSPLRGPVGVPGTPPACAGTV